LETEWVSILEILKKGGFEASVITTFNAYFPFYEDVVLRQLNSSGCRHNLLLMDAGRLSESLEIPASRPQFAGHSYTLIPVSAKGAFHPKLALLVAKKKGLLLVGSHNTTLSGWGLNKELTNCIAFADSDGEGVQLASHAWAFLKRWVAGTPEGLPTPLRDAFQAVKQFAPWLSDNPQPGETDLRFFGSTPGGETLWSKVSRTINGPIKRVTVVGPFFDSRLDFVRTLKRDLNPKEIVIGVEPDSVSMPEIDHKKAGLKFVDASQVPKSSGYLHAKAVYIEGVSGEKWLLTGSANPSQPAWDAPEKTRNAEAVILHSGKAAGDIAKKLGIAGFQSLSPLSDANWLEIKRRVQEEGKRVAGELKRCLIGVAKDGLILIDKSAFPVGEYLEAFCFDEFQNKVAECKACEISGEHISIPVTGDTSTVRFLEIRLSRAKTIFCLVHHEEEIKRRSMSSRQVQFRRSLAALHEGNPDLENLILTIEKIIFDEPFEIDPSAKRRQGLRRGGKTPEDEKEITSLATSLSETKKEKLRKRLVTSGDIGYLLDYLIHRLGEGIERDPPETGEKGGRSEEELVGTDDEEPDKGIEVIDTPKLVKICNGKVRRLVGRMIQNFEKAGGLKDGCEKCLVKLLGVLALLRELRSLDNKLEGVPLGETFVPVCERERLLKQSLKYLYGRDHCFLAKIDTGAHAHPWDEMSRLHGLLLWLAHDCGADLTAGKGFNESPEDKKKRIANVSYMLLITPDAVSDRESLNEAEVSIERTTRKHRVPQAQEWVKSHVTLGEKLFRLKQRAHLIQNKINYQPQTEFWAFVRGEINPTLHIVLIPGDPVTLTDICSEDGKRMFQANKVAAFRFRQP
jgi:hypothetical protein